MNFRKHITSLLYITCCLIFNSACSQDITAPKNSYSIDAANNIIVWHVNEENSSVLGKKATEINFEGNFKATFKSSRLSYENSYDVSKNGKTYKLYLTKLPLVHITLDTMTLNTDKKFGGHFSYYNNSKFIESEMGIRRRGNLSLTFPKKSYDIEFWNDTISKEKKDLKFEGLRDDDDLILDGLYNEPLKLRAQIAAELWEDIHQPYYAIKEPDAKSSYRSNYVELFVNGSYTGVYSFSESVDRKQLKLKKNKETLVRGELFKANSYAGGPDFKVAGEFNNAFPHYVGFRMEYPVIDYESHWNNLSELLELVVNKTDAEFSSAISKKLHIENAIDYYLFINTIGAVDNFGKNYYLAKYTTNEPYFFVPWDLDSSFGLVQNAEKYTVTDRTFSNNLFDRLISVNPDNYKSKLKKRWKELRASAFSTENITNRFKSKYDEFSNQKVYEREALVWPKKTSDKNDYTYLTEWVAAKMTFLDGYFEAL
jgi:spore coat protein H